MQMHGESRTRLYSIWKGMKTRCHNLNARSYLTYGGKGVVVCDEWRNDYMAFYRWAMQNGYTDDLTIDRIDSNGNYCPENCRWLTPFLNNSYGHARYVEVDGERKSLREWLKDPRCQVSSPAFFARLKNGMEFKDALMTPPARPEVQLTAFGETKTQREWANDGRCVVPYDSLRSRVEKGWCVEEALVTPTRPQKRLTAFGETKTRGEWVKDERCKVSYWTLRSRTENGWPAEQAMTAPN